MSMSAHKKRKLRIKKKLKFLKLDERHAFEGRSHKIKNGTAGRAMVKG